MGIFGKIFGGSSEKKWNVVNTALTIGSAIGTIGAAVVGASVIRGMAKREDTEVELPEDNYYEIETSVETESEEEVETKETK